MNLLAVNTSGFSASIALGLHLPESIIAPAKAADDSGKAYWKCMALDSEEKTAKALIPRIQELLQSAATVLADIDLFAVASGPGSFTGLRIGITSIKTLAYVFKKQVAAVNTLAAIAQNAVRSGCWKSGNLSVIVNAFRRQFFVATFNFDEFDKMVSRANSITSTIGHDELIEYVDQNQSLVGGPGVEVLDSDSRTRLGSRLIEEDLNQSALGIGELAASSGFPRVDPIEVLPQYFRGSAAEEKLAQNP